MRDVLRVLVVMCMSEMLERRQVNTKVLPLECSTRCKGSSMEDWVGLSVENQTV